MRTDLLEHKVLDKGYLKIVEAWGTGYEGVDKGLHADYPSDYEVGIIEAARMSTGKGFMGWENDFKLLTYLLNHAHETPFEMAGMTIEVSAPIFVFREWHRHRVPFGYNEMSARYIPLPDENYVPTLDRLKLNSTTNKQAQGTTPLCDNDVILGDWLTRLENVYAEAEEVYKHGLSLGIPKELARLPVPVARYSRMRATGNLRGWLGFLTLRMAPQAQWEIRQYANAVGIIIQQVFPRTWDLFSSSREAAK